MSKFRGFIAIDIEAFPKIKEFEKEISETNANIKLVKPENIHITLKFLGDTNETLIDKIQEIIKESIKEIKPFTIRLKGTGVFPNPNYIKIIWIGIEGGNPIGRIVSEIDKKLSNLGFRKQKRGFSPHLTIARVRSAKNKKKLVEIIERYKDTEFANLQVNSIKLKKSVLTPKGPIYTTLREVKI